ASWLSAQSSISIFISRELRRASSTISSACRSAIFTISVCDASRTACSRASARSRSTSRFASASISWRSLTIQRACLISSGIVARDARRGPARVVDRHGDGLETVHEEDGHADLGEIEAPGAHEGEIVVDPAVDAAAERLGEGLAEEAL